jgi:hypothetical protein
MSVSTGREGCMSESCVRDCTSSLNAVTSNTVLSGVT